MQRVLVTGARGYIGKHVIPALLKRGADVTELDSHGPAECETKRIVLDIGKNDFAKVRPSDYDICLHLAWRNGFVHNDDSHILDLSAHYSFLSHLIDGGVGKIVVMGTMHEVGYWEGEITSETPCNPLSKYAIAKDSLRKALEIKAVERCCKLCWLRGFYIVGDDAGSQSVFGKIVRASESGQHVFPFTSGKNKYDFISINALSEQIAACTLSESAEGVINCCTGQPQTLASRVEAFIVEQGLDIMLEYGAYPDRPYDSPGIWGDATQINEIMLRDREILRRAGRYAK